MRPLDSNYANNLETFNEVTSVFILYTLMLFTDYINDPIMRSSIGTIYIGIIMVFALCHLTPLFYDVIKQIYWRIKRFSIKRYVQKQRNKRVDNNQASSKQVLAPKTNLTNISEEKSEQLESIVSG